MPTKEPAAGLRGVRGVDDMADALDKLGDRGGGGGGVYGDEGSEERGATGTSTGTGVWSLERRRMIRRRAANFFSY